MATNLDPDDMTNRWDVFVHDLRSGRTQLVSSDSTGAVGNGHSCTPALSADGRYVAFKSLATNLTAGDTHGNYQVYVHDCLTGRTVGVSVDSQGNFGHGDSRGNSAPAISADGRFVAFDSTAYDLVTNDSNADIEDVFVHDRDSDQDGVFDEVGGTSTMLASISSAGVQGDSFSYEPSLSADGRLVAFTSDASNLVPTNTNSYYDVFVHDCVSGSTIVASVAWNEDPAKTTVSIRQSRPTVDS